MDTLSLIILLTVGFFALVCAIGGLRQGISRQIIRVVTIAVSVLLAVIISKALYTKVFAYFDGTTSEEIYSKIMSLGILPAGMNFEWIKNVDVETVRSILVIPLVLIAIPLLFTGTFIILSGITKLIHVILCGIFGLSKRNKSAFGSFAGFLLGAAEGIVIAALLFTPLIGTVNAAEKAVIAVNEEMPDSAGAKDLTTIYDTYLKPISDNAIVSKMGDFGVNALYSALVTVEDKNGKTDMSDLLPDFAMIYANGKALKQFHWQTLTPENIAAINAITDILEDNPYLTDLSASAVRSMAAAYQSAAIRLPIGPPYDTVVNEMVHILESETSETIHTDIDTILAIYYILSESGSLAAFAQDSDAMLKSLTAKDSDGVTPITKILDEVKKNERTKPLISVITKLSVSVMQENLGLSQETTEVYENVKEGLNETLKIDRADFGDGEVGEAEYREAVADSIDTTLQDNGIKLEPEIVDSMADYVAENFKDTEEITDDELNDVILSYYDAYLEYQESGVIPDGVPAP